jgi:pimeloyl-ACP methyl ester carboxylesterase
MDIRSGYADVNGAHLYYEEAGQGFPLVMVHAGIADHSMWADQFAYFAPKYRVICMDMRSVGKSTAAQGPFAPREDIYGLLQHLGVERAFLMGCSMGGSASIDFTCEHQNMVAGLITVGSGLSGFEFEGEPPQYWEEYEAAEKANDIDQAAEYAVRIWVDSRHRTPDQLDPALRARALAMARVAESATTDYSLLQPLDPPATDRLSTLRVPLLAIVGDLDDPNINRIADTLVTTVPGARKYVLKGTAHLPNMERPDEFNQVVAEFLEEAVKKL